MRRAEAAPDREDDEAEAADAKEEGERVKKEAGAKSQENYQACLERTVQFIYNNGKPDDEEVSIPF